MAKPIANNNNSNVNPYQTSTIKDPMANTSSGKVNVNKIEKLPNTGTTETNTGLAGLGLAMLTGLFAVARRRKNDKN